MLMTIKFSRRIYQDPIIRTLELVRYECFINHTWVLSCDQFCAQICTLFQARLINEGHCEQLPLTFSSLLLSIMFVSTRREHTAHVCFEVPYPVKPAVVDAEVHRVNIQTSICCMCPGFSRANSDFQFNFPTYV